MFGCMASFASVCLYVLYLVMTGVDLVTGKLKENIFN